MSATSIEIRSTKRRVASFQKNVRSCKDKADREPARIQALEFDERQKIEGLLREATTLFRELETCHESRISAVMAGSEEPSLEVDKEIYVLYDRCHKSFRRINGLIERLEFDNITFQNTPDFLVVLGEIRDVISQTSEPSTPIAKISRSASSLLVGSFSAARHE